ncbi:hypothetical protein PE36_06292 [Moritella sp. PE36]|uniref:acyltransferase family protein n=1 Tax=Moritella sp. PE36 TaxID=58051 RepID=UPI0001568314|nr:acyltransferase [Moritella sp. PE36]EDM69073.1 hypothetical protein PE36_06292 [Moritella sp. PE36]
MFYSVNFLRAVAASLVVFLHFSIQYSNHFDAEFDLSILGVSLEKLGSIGVDIFFIISGFVIYTSSMKKKNIGIVSFLRSRLKRIMPLYLIFTLIYIVISAATSLSKYNFDTFHFISSLFLFPAKNADGLYAPILYVAWTLSYEIYFYITYVFAMKAFGGSLKLYISALVTPIVLFAMFYDLDGFIQTRDVIFNPMLLEFIMGILIAKYVYLIRSVNWKVGVILFSMSIVIGIVFSYFDSNDYYRFLFYGIPSTLLIISFLILDDSRIFRSKLFCLLGNSSYSLYLSHVFTLPFFIKIIVILDFDEFYLTSILSVIFCYVFAVISYKYIELRFIPAIFEINRKIKSTSY